MTIAENEGVDLYDLQSGTCLRSFNIPYCAGSFHAFDQSHLLVFQAEKPLLQIWCWKTGQLKAKIPLTEKLTSLTVSNDGIYCVAGTGSGRLSVWELATGRLLREWSAHYKAITALRFTSDDVFLLSGGGDAVLNAWLFGDVVAAPTSDLASNQATDAPCPWVEWADHSLPLSSLSVGLGGLSGKVVSSSLDRTCRIWDLPSKRLMSSISFPTAIHCACLDPAEQFLYAGGSDGRIFVVDLMQRIPTYPSTASGMPEVLVSHRQAVTSLSCSFDGSLLLSGSLDATASVWDTASRQQLRVLKKHRKTIGATAILREPAVPGRKTWARLDKHTKPDSGLCMSLPTQRSAKTVDDHEAKKRRTLGQGCQHFMTHGQGTATREEVLVARVEAQTGQNASLRASLVEWQAVNKSLYALCAKSTLKTLSA